MGGRDGILGLLSLALTTLATLAADLSKIDRHIVKEPAYQSKPLYCLAIIGPEAKARVWLVLDGDRLYVDRNANGDLTDDGEPVRLPDKKSSIVSFPKVE